MGAELSAVPIKSLPLRFPMPSLQNICEAHTAIRERGKNRDVIQFRHALNRTSSKVVRFQMGITMASIENSNGRPRLPPRVPA